MRKATCRLAVFLLAVTLSLLCAPVIRSDGGPDHQKFQTRPIPLGVSGGNINDSSRAFCCGGTLGALVQDAAGIQYILSNNHVLARTNLGIVGEDIIQPGLIDQDPVCAKDANDAVADLSAFVPIRFTKGTTNKVDAAIAQVRAGAVDTGGTILDIGQLNTSIVTAGLGMGVKKSGRTTGLTTGSVTAVDVTVDVAYNKQCGIGTQIARFTGQIAIGPGGFSAGGDSGSVIVEDVTTCPRAVGLLFAGSSTTTIANPIGDVLSAFGVSMVGCSGASAKMKGGQAGAQGAPVNPADVARASDVKSRHEEALFNIPGVVGTGVGLSLDGRGVVIEVYVEAATDEVRRAVPTALEGVPVRIVQTGKIIAF